MNKIMVVDDEAVIVMQLKESLSSMGYDSTLSASSGEEAVRLARTENPDIIILDIIMQGTIDGIEASRIIKQELNIPVIFLTAYIDDAYLNKAKLTEPYGYIIKPFQNHQVKAAIDIALFKKEAELRVLESEKKYRSVVENANEGILVIKGNKIVFINKNISSEYGYTIDDAPSRSAIEFIYPDDRPEVMRLYKDIKMGKPTNLRLKPIRVFDSDANIRWVESNVITIDWKHEPAILVFINEVTQRIQQEEELKKSRKKFKQLFEESPIPLCLVNFSKVAKKVYNHHFLSEEELKEYFDAHTEYVRELITQIGIIEINKVSLEFYGALDKKGFQRITKDLIDENVIRSFKNALVSVYLGKKSFYDEFETATFTGEKKYVSLSCNVTPGNEKTYSEVLFSITDLTKQREAEEILTRAKEVLEAEVEERARDLITVNVELERELALRKTTEDALRKSELKYRTLIENAHDVVVVSRDDRIIFSNAVGAELTGYSEEELLTMTFSEFLHPDDKSMAMERRMKRLAGEYVPNVFTARIINRHGKILWLEGNGTIIEWNGKPATANFLKDITKRKQYEEALKVSEERYRTLVESARDSIFSLDVSGSVISVNKEGARVLGKKPEEIIGKTIHDLFPEDIAQNQIENVKKVLELHEPSVISETITKYVDDYRWINTSLTPIYNYDGSLQSILGIARDITEIKKNQEKIRESEYRWRTLFQNSQDVVYLTSFDRKVIDINNAGEKLLGYDREELLTIDAARLYDNPDDETKIFDIIGTQEYIKNMDVTLKRKDGVLVDCLLSATPLRNDQGVFYGFQGIIKDITERKSLYNVVLDSISDGVYTVDLENQLTSFNTAAEKITGVGRADAIGKKCHEVLHLNICPKNCVVQHSLKIGSPHFNKAVQLTNSSMKKIPVSVSGSALHDKDGNIIGGVCTFRDISVIEELRKEIHRKYSFEDIVSKNRKIEEIFEILYYVAESESTVLIQGKSGTGKELFSRAIHSLSTRNTGPFVPVNCAALPETLLESELFGYVRGAFTNAIKDKPGRFDLAQGGTIFLDEVAELTPALQVKLLRVLQEKEYEPLGSVKTIKANVRVIASTNRDLSTEVEEGRFREDLYYRLNVVKLEIPELKERREDIPILIDHFIDKMSLKMGKEIHSVSDDVMSILMNYDFPGNVRELENIIEHAFVLCQGRIITLDHLPKELLKKIDIIRENDQTLKDEVMNAEMKIIAHTLAQFDGDRMKTAQALNMGRATLWRKMKKYNLL